MSRSLLGAKEVQAVIEGLVAEVCRKEADLSGLILVGIRTRGVIVAQRLQAKLRELEGKTLPVGLLDITLYRDDLTSIASQPVVKRTELPFSIEGRGLILVDDVLYTGRTVRAALDALMDFGRPAFIKLLCLVDRGWRELPIYPDYVGKIVKTKQKENVQVYLKETDGRDGVSII